LKDGKYGSGSWWGSSNFKKGRKFRTEYIEHK
jgi:hypothetical protein